MPSAAPSKSELRLLRPLTRCATITPRPPDYKAGSSGLSVTGGTHYTPKSPDHAVPDVFLTSIGDNEDSRKDGNQVLSGEELYGKLKDRVKLHYPDIKQAFYALDSNRSSFISLVEFRKVVENFIFPITDQQFEALIKQVDGVKNQAVNYNQLLFKLNKTNRRETPTLGRITPANLNLDNIVKKLQRKLDESGEKISKAMRMFDIKLNGKIRKADLKRVLENFAFHISKEQFDKLYKYYDVSKDGEMEYIGFLKSVISTSLPIKPPSVSPTNELVIFEEKEDEMEAEKEENAKLLWCETVPLVDVEIKLRSKIKHRIQLLHRVFRSVDIHDEGYVTLQQLRRILEKFAFPMTDLVFERLMSRMEVNAKNKIRYETFLYKFQGRRVGGFGQSINIKSNHRYHPVIESTEEPSLDELLAKLKSKVSRGYSSIKQAFLVFDENKSGKILRRDFKNVIDGFCYRTTDAQFSKLMAMLDPKGKGYVSYHEFFSLFDETMANEVQGWQSSQHSKNIKDPIAPKYLHDDKFIHHLAKKINDDRKAVAIAFNQYNSDGSGTVSKIQLKNFLQRFNIPFSKEQYGKLLRGVTSNSDGSVNFYDVMRAIGVDLTVQDEGVSARIAEESAEVDERRVELHNAKVGVLTQRAMDHTKLLSADDVIHLLQDYFHQRSVELRNLFTKYDDHNTGKISRAAFRRLLVKVGFYMNDVQFKELCSRMNIKKHISYQDFLSNFQDQTMGVYSNDLKRVPRITAGMPVTGMSVEDGLSHLKQKLQNSYRNLSVAFHAIDRDNDGLVNRTDLVSVLTRFLIPMSRENITQLWRQITGGKKRINVQQFVSFFEEQEDADAHRWLVSVYKTRDVRPSSQLKADAVLNTFRMKALDRFSSLQKCFTYLDRDNKGKLNRKKLKQALSEFGISVSNEEFQKFWKYFDEENRGYIDHEGFILKCAGEFTPGDTGVSKAIVEANQSNNSQFQSDQMYRREDQLLHNIHTMRYLPNDELEKKFRTNIHHNFVYLRDAFRAVDKDSFGFVRKSDLRKILFDLHFLVDDTQLNFLLTRCGLGNKKRINYERFMAFFEQPQHPQKGSENLNSLEDRIAPFVAAYPHLSLDEAIARMRYCISEIQDILLQAFSAVDIMEYGVVQMGDVKRVLDNFCFIMTDKQFSGFSKNFPVVSDGKVDYKQLLSDMSDLEGLRGIESIKQDSKNWLEAVLGKKKDGRRTVSSLSGSVTPYRSYHRSKSCTNLDQETVRPTTAPFVSADHIEHQIEEQVKLSWMLLHKYFKERSSDKLTVPTEVFQRGLQEVNIVLPVDDMALLCRKYDSRNDGNVNYSEFLKKFSVIGRRSRCGSRNSSRNSDSQLSFRSARLSDYSYNLKRGVSCTSLDDLRPETARSISRSIASQMGLRRSATQIGDLTPGPGFEPPPHVIASMTSHVVSNWKSLRKLFKEQDKNHKGWVSTTTFRDILRSSHMDIEETDFSALLAFYDSQSNGHVYYNDFLRAFLSITKVD